MDKYFKLQNGSDVRGVALEGVEGEPVNLTADISRTIGYAFSQWLEKKLGKSGPEGWRWPRFASLSRGYQDGGFPGFGKRRMLGVRLRTGFDAGHVYVDRF